MSNPLETAKTKQIPKWIIALLAALAAGLLIAIAIIFGINKDASNNAASANEADPATQTSQSEEVNGADSANNMNNSAGQDAGHSAQQEPAQNAQTGEEGREAQLKLEAAVAGPWVAGTDYIAGMPEIAAVQSQIWRSNPKDPQTLGPDSAPVKVSLFADYSCPMCTRLELESMPAIKALAKAGKIQLQWNDFPIFASRYNSDKAARGGVAAAKQGKFWEYNEQAFIQAGDGHPNYDDELVFQIAQKAGITNMTKFKADYADPATAQAVTEAGVQAQAIGLQGTPAMLINKAYISGAIPTQVIINTIMVQSKVAGK